MLHNKGRTAMIKIDQLVSGVFTEDGHEHEFTLKDLDGKTLRFFVGDQPSDEFPNKRFVTVGGIDIHTGGIYIFETGYKKE